MTDRPAPARRQRRVAAGLGLGVSVLVAILGWLGLLQPLRGLVSDAFLQLRGAGEMDPRIAVVAVDQESIDRYGRWPWRRDRVAGLLRRLDDAGVAVYALDVVFSEPSRRDEVVDLSAEDRALAAALEETGQGVLGYFFRNRPPAGHSPPPELNMPPFSRVTEPPDGPFPIPLRRDVEPNLDLFAGAAAGQGFFDQKPDQGVHRYYSLVARFAPAGQPEELALYYPALALAAVAELTGEPLTLSYHHGELPMVRLGERRIGADETGTLWINYRGPAGTVATYPAVDVLEGRVGAEELSGALVFVGFTESGLGEIYSSPFGGEMTGVEVHAQVADTLLHGRTLRNTGVERLISLVVLLLMGPLVGLAVVGFERRQVGVLLALGLIGLWVVVAYLVFLLGGRYLEVVPPVLAGVFALVAQVGYLESRARAIRRTFRQYVSGAVVEEMLAHPEQVRLGGEEREMTVLFCDIRGFTSLSENREPEQIVQLLNRFFTPMTDLVLQRGGTLDKYMGDAMMAFFGAPTRQPDHARRACRAALAMERQMETLNDAFRGEGVFPPDSAGLGIGMGLNSGPMAVGNMGSDRVFDYTVIGDHVNLGSRVEGLSRRYEVLIVVTEFTCAAVGEEFLFRELDWVRVKGRREPVAIFELMAERPGRRVPEEERQRFAALEEKARAFEAALALYREADFAIAARGFEELLRQVGEDGPAEHFAALCRELAEQPPAGSWDGVATLKSK